MLDEFIGCSPAICKLRRSLPAYSDEVTPLVITGEPGVGKSLFASHIHALSRYRSVPSETLNFSLLSDRDQRVALFGGGPPDLTTTRRSVLENPTSVIIKHIHRACGYYQDQLADSLKRQSVRRAGTNEEHAVGCRPIFALPESPSNLIRDGTLSPHLGAFLTLCKRIFIPPLRKRSSDIPSLVEYFCRSYREKFNCSNDISQLDMSMLQKQRWSENIRELRAFIRGGFILRCDDEIRCTEKTELMKMLTMLEEGREFSLPVSLEKIERGIVARVLEKCGNHRADAARLLGLTERALRRKSAR